MNIVLDTDRLILKTSNKKMLDDIYKFHKKNAEFWKPWEAKTSEEDHTKNYYRFLIRAEKKERRAFNGLYFWIYLRDEDKLIGKVAVFGIHQGNLSNCMIGYKLGEEHVGQGYMHEALSKVTQFMFDKIKIHRIEINILPRNIRSIRVAERLGFSLECESREFMEVNGVWENHLRYVKINDNYK